MRLLWKDKRDQFRALVVQPASESLANGKEKLAVPTEPVTFAITFGYMNVAYNKRRRDVQVVFDMPNEQFWRHFSLSEAKLMRLRHEVADVFAGGTLSGAAKVCAPRFFVTGSFKSPVRGEESVGAMQPAVSNLCSTCGSSDRQRRDPPQVDSLPENGGGEGNLQ
ncbi:hypothetical protein MRX96_054061 [Rhipicephalus microplus]